MHVVALLYERNLMAGIQGCQARVAQRRSDLLLVEAFC
jgi:hypothetical protein